MATSNEEISLPKSFAQACEEKFRKYQMKVISKGIPGGSKVIENLPRYFDGEEESNETSDSIPIFS